MQCAGIMVVKFIICIHSNIITIKGLSTLSSIITINNNMIIDYSGDG